MLSVVIMLYCYCVALLLFVLSYVFIVCTVPLPPGVNPIQSTNISINLNALRELLIFFSTAIGLTPGGSGTLHTIKT